MTLAASRTPFDISHYGLGVSQTACQLTEYIVQIRNHAAETISLGWREVLNQRLIEIQSRCDKEGWDGYDAKPINRKTMFAAMIFLQSVPDYITPPDIVPEPTGEVGFLWEKGEEITVLVSISPETIVYAELIGSNKSHGESKFQKEIPPNIEKTLLDFFCMS